MIEKALRYIVGLKDAKMFEIDGHKYTDKDLELISFNPKAEQITMTTLTSLVEYIKSSVDEMNGKMIIHVVSPTRVELYSSLDNERKREYIVKVEANLPSFNFNSWMDHETFCIALQSKFAKNTDRDLLLKFAGTVESGTIAQYGDDGVSQKATIKTGIASKGDALVPNPVHLAAYRTFLEVDQPEVQYVFRMQERNGVQCALYEADGGAWRYIAMENVKDYLKKQLKNCNNFTIIS